MPDKDKVIAAKTQVAETLREVAAIEREKTRLAEEREAKMLSRAGLAERCIILGTMGGIITWLFGGALVAAW